MLELNPLIKAKDEKEDFYSIEKSDPRFSNT